MYIHIFLYIYIYISDLAGGVLMRPTACGASPLSESTGAPAPAPGCGVWGSGFGVWGFEFRVGRFRVYGLGFKAQGLGFRVWGLGFRTATSMSWSVRHIADMSSVICIIQDSHV